MSKDELLKDLERYEDLVNQDLEEEIKNLKKEKEEIINEKINQILDNSPEGYFNDCSDDCWRIDEEINDCNERIYERDMLKEKLKRFKMI